MNKLKVRGAVLGLWGRFYQKVRLVTSGGKWSRSVPVDIQINLRWFFFDGFFSSGQDGIAITYISLYLLALGATSGQIGLMASLASLGATLMLLPGAMLVERLGKRKWIVLLSGGGVTRLMILLLAIIPFFLKGSLAIFIAIGLKVIADGFSNFGLPAWTSLAGDIVPLSWRGHYFGSKNFFMAACSIVVILVIGYVISQVGSISGYQVAFGIAFIFGTAATFSYSHIKEPDISELKPRPQAYSIGALVRTLKDDLNFSHYALFAIVWNMAIGVAGPFFSVYMIEGLKGNANEVGIMTIAGILAGVPALRFFGNISDRWGPRKVMLFTGFLIPSVPLIWLLVHSPYQGILANIPAGIMWAGFNLAAFNFLLSLAPPAKRARYTALFQIAVAISTAAGAALGGLIVTRFGYIPIFVVSGVGRLIGIIIFARFVRQKKEEPTDLALGSS